MRSHDLVTFGLMLLGGLDVSIAKIQVPRDAFRDARLFSNVIPFGGGGKKKQGLVTNLSGAEGKKKCGNHSIACANVDPKTLFAQKPQRPALHPRRRGAAPKRWNWSSDRLTTRGWRSATWDRAVSADRTSRRIQHRGHARRLVSRGFVRTGVRIISLSWARWSAISISEPTTDKSQSRQLRSVTPPEAK
jgi:hypothetical protein